MERDDVKKLAWSIGIAWFVMAMGKFIYRCPKTWCLLYVFALYAQWDDGEDMTDAGFTALSWFFFWALANVVVMVRHGIDGWRNYSSLATAAGLVVFFFIMGAVRETSGLQQLGASVVILIVGLLLVPTIIRHHIEFLDCHGANVYLTAGGAIGLLCVPIFASGVGFVAAGVGFVIHHAIERMTWSHLSTPLFIFCFLAVMKGLSLIVQRPQQHQDH